MQSFKLQVDKQQLHCQYYHMMLDLYNFICLKSVTELKSDVQNPYFNKKVELCYITKTSGRLTQHSF